MQEKGVQEQRSMNAQAQNQVIAELEGKGHKPGSIYKYKYTPYIAMTVDGAALDALLSSPDVISIEEDIPVPPTLDWSVPRIGAAQLHAINITGSGVVVAVLDIGVDKTHPFLLGSVVSEACYSTNDPVNGSSSLCPGGVTESEADGSALPYGGSCPVSECDHGTHVAGIVAGRDGISGSPGPGVAPEAGIIAIQIFSLFASEANCGAGEAPCVKSWTSDEIKGLERVYELRSTYSISSANMSLGGGTYAAHCDQESPGLKSAIDNLRAAGIATVVASGNGGNCGAISFPACISSAISVGATTDSDTVASYSNSASFLSLLAPGSFIISSIPGNTYQNLSGTSMATPHVAGSWALMKQAFPGATVDSILSVFTSTGLSVTDQDCTSVTKQRINVYEAYNLLTSNNASLTVSKTGTGTGTVTSNPLGINCGSDCSEAYANGIAVDLTASPDTGSTFNGWTGCDLVNGNTCTVMMTTNKSVNVAFTLHQYTLIATKTGSGSGNLIASGLSCIGNTCTGTYDYNTTVNIEAVATTGSFFDGWTGCDSATYNVCTVLINADRNITASFRATYKGTVGTELTLADSDFGTKKGKVLIGGLKQKVESWSDASVTMIVNKFKGLAVDTPYDVSIQPKEPKDTPAITLPGAFTLKKPEIDPVSTATGSPEDEITINGMWFGTKKGKVYVGGQKCKVTSWSMDPTTGVSTAKFIVHKKLGAGSYFLEVENKIGRYLSFGFEVK